MRRALAIIAPAVLSLTACGAAPADLLATKGCDPLVPEQCGFPLPSNVWLVDDAATKTGKHVQFGPATLPQQAGMPTDPKPWAASDGFSPGMTVLTVLQGATATGLPNESSLPLSISTQSPTILLNTRTGALVPHIAEIDRTADLDTERAFMIRPVIRLDDGTRYIVAIRHVVDAAGEAIEPSPGFRALRDGESFTDVSIDRRRALYDDIFFRLATIGVARHDLQMAWDYTTASRDNNTRTMLVMRDAALAAVGDAGPRYTITQAVENPNPQIRRRIIGLMHAPLFLDQATPKGKMLYDDRGLPRQNGFADFEFLVQIPHSAASGVPAAILQNGHGLLGSKEEGQNSYMAVICDEKRYVEIAVNMFGFARGDANAIVDAISADLGSFRHVVERQQQGMLNQLMAMRMMKGSFYKDPMVQFNGASAIDPTHCYYRGDSQGGIMGAVYMALSTDVRRGLLGEAGMPYALMLNRSVDFKPYFTLSKLVTSNAFEIQLSIGLVQMLWDRIEPNGYAPYITENMPPGTPSHNILLHVAIGDHQVTPLSAHVIARAVGAKNMKPVNREVFQVPSADSPFDGNGIVEWDFGLPPAPITNTPMTAGKDPHDEVRKLQSARDQTDLFFRTGKIENTCGGACRGPAL